MIEVELPDGSIAEFPDGTPNDVMKAAIQKRFPTQQPQATPQVKAPPQASGFDFRDAVAREMGTGQYAPPVEQARVAGNPEASPLPGFLGDTMNTLNAFNRNAQDISTLRMGDEIYAGLTSPFREQGIPGLFNGKGFDIGAAFSEGLQPAEERSRNIRDLNPQAYDAGAIPGSLALLGKSPSRSGAPMPTGKKLLAQSTAQGAGAGAVMEFGGEGSLEERGWRALKGGATGAGTGWVGGKLVNSFVKGAPPKVPTTKQHLDAAKSSFDTARSSGAVVVQPKGAQLMDDMRQILVDDGAITPSGKIAGYPKIQHALDLADDYATAPMTMENLLKVRKQVAKAAGSIDPDERRLAAQMLRTLDDGVIRLKGTAGDFMQGAGDQAVRDWARGREFYHIGKKAESVEKLTAGAVRQSKKSAAVPVEQATRNKFDNFVNKESNLRGFKPEEIDALKAVGDGSVVGNAAKQAGRLAPTTLGGVGVKAGIPFAVGNAIGGPPVGMALAGTTMSIGVIGKIIARLSTDQKAKLASIIVRNGGKLPKGIPQNLPAPLKNALGNLMLTAGGSGEARQAILSSLGINSPEAVR
jgi:hypothetical protein